MNDGMRSAPQGHRHHPIGVLAATADADRAVRRRELDQKCPNARTSVTASTPWPARFG